MAETLGELAERLAHLAQSGLRKVELRVIEGAIQDLEARAKVNIETRLEQRSRKLATSLRHELKETPDGVVGTVTAGGTWQGLKVPYARLQEYGGTVVPVNGKYLTIPVGPALNAIGQAKYESARQAPGLQFVQSLKGQPLLVKLKKGPKGSAPTVEVWYVLRTSVTLPARRYLRDAQASVLAELPERLAREAAGLLGAA